MTDPIGIRLPEEMLEKIGRISKRELVDRSTIIRKLVMLGYSNFIKKTAMEEYMRGSITLSNAAEQAGLTIWEMEKYLIENGYKSDYSIEDFEKEMKMMK